MAAEIIPFIWYDGEAETAARFYVSLLPGSSVDRVIRAPADTPVAAAGAPLMVDFTLAGRRYAAMNGGPGRPHTDAVSFQVVTEDQAETDRLWDALTADGGEAVACGWLKDRWGLRWQITPRRLLELMTDPDAGRARRAFEAMMGMVRIDIAALDRAADGEGETR